MTQARAPRADAVRNRAKILDAAREQITRNGADTAMTDIATAAGVAVGTLYRHFPTKTDLVAAVIGEFVVTVADDVERARDRAADGAPPFAELAGFLARVVDAAAHNHAVKAAAHLLGADSGDTDSEHRASVALAELIDIGRRAGQVHDDVTVADVHLLIATAPVDRPAADRARWLTLLAPGLSTTRPAVG